MRIRPNQYRIGSATVELAVCLPVLVIIVMGSLSATSMIFMRSAAVQSAYETIKEAVRQDGDVAGALAQGRAVLEFRNLTADSITFEPANVAAQDRGTPVTVTVVTSATTNGLFSFGPFANQVVEVQATMLKE